jgi:hypothetical protein
METIILDELGVKLDIPSNATEAIKITLEFMLARVDDWKNVVPEGKNLKFQCELFYSLIKDLLKYPELPIANILKNIKDTIVSTITLINNFLKEENKKRSMLDNIEYNIIRIYDAYSYRQTFRATTKTLESTKTKIEEILKLSKELNKPTVHMYSNHMVNHESLVFWKEIFGEEINKLDGFELFINHYQEKYNIILNSDIIERINRLSCSSDHIFNISGYITLTKICGFPINIEKLPSLVDSKSIDTAQIRIEVAKMVNELISYFSTKEMRDSIVSVFKWYKGGNKRNKEEWQKRANKWAETISEMRKKDPKSYTDDEHLADSVDIARRTYSFFFQRYMVIYKIGKVSKDTFGNVDFPGKARIFEFIEHFEPLDKANFLIVMKQPPEKWIDKKPKVYTFLRSEILKIEDPDLQSKKEIYHNDNINKIENLKIMEK